MKEDGIGNVEGRKKKLYKKEDMAQTRIYSQKEIKYNKREKIAICKLNLLTMIKLHRRTKYTRLYLIYRNP